MKNYTKSFHRFQRVKSSMVLCMMIFCLGSINLIAQDCPVQFIEKNGLVVMEVESVEPSSGWELRYDMPGYSGYGFFEWKGGNKFSSPGSGLLNYKVWINTPGTYRFHWRCKVGKGSDFTEHNDTWLRFPDAAGFYAVSESDTVRPHGVCSDDCPQGAGSQGWFKVYSSGTAQWTWSSRTSDHDPHNIRADFDTAGIYTIQLSGRSDNHFVDRLVLFHEEKVDYHEAVNLDNPESLCDNWKLPFYSPRFRVRGNDNYIENAEVVYNDSIKYTDRYGSVYFFNLERGFTDTLEIKFQDFHEFREEITVFSDADRVIELDPLKYSVIFEISDGVTPIPEATITLYRVNENKMTGDDGTVVFTEVPGLKNYNYLVRKEGYLDNSGIVELERTDHKEIVEMSEINTGLKEQDSKIIHFFPNPATDRIRIVHTGQNLVVDLKSMNGHVLRTWVDPEESSIDVSRFSPGNYVQDMCVDKKEWIAEIVRIQ